MRAGSGAAPVALPSTMPNPPSSVGEVTAALAQHGYLADEGLATAVFLALRLHRPLLLEGEAGVGKTEVAKVLARWTGGELIRLQCYEGIDVSPGRLRVGLRPPAPAPAGRRGGRRATGGAADRALEDELYSERFLVRRPLLRADRPPRRARRPCC